MQTGPGRLARPGAICLLNINNLRPGGCPPPPAGRAAAGTQICTGSAGKANWRRGGRIFRPGSGPGEGGRGCRRAGCFLGRVEAAAGSNLAGRNGAVAGGRGGAADSAAVPEQPPFRDNPGTAGNAQALLHWDIVAGVARRPRAARKFRPLAPAVSFAGRGDARGHCRLDGRADRTDTVQPTGVPGGDGGPDNLT